MMVEIPITFGFDFETVVGHMQIEEDIAKTITDGEPIQISWNLRVGVGQETQLTGATLILVPSLPKE